MTNIEYSRIINNQNNIIFFISKTAELNNISLPTSLEIDLKNKNLSKNLLNNKIIDINLYQKNKEFKLIFVLTDPNTSNPLNIGSSLVNKYDYNIDKNICFYFSDKLIKNSSKLISDIILGFQIKLYKYDKFIKKKNLKPKNLTIFSKNKINPKLKKQINYDQNLIKAINFTKDLVSEPANVLNPVSYVERCKNLNIKGLKIKILNLEDLKKIGMRSLLAVSAGSNNEPRVLIFEWNLKKNVKPIVLAGKGVTFDTGGISLKPSSGMEEMITDMGGSAVVSGSLINAALNNINKSIVGIIGLVENMPDANAQRPGDIVTSLSGQTIEVLNTDAEGRMVLADIITYVQKKYKPSEIIDFATLTGAIMIALGTHKAGLFSNNDKLSNKLINAGENVNENVWRLPMGVEYNSEINSSRADMKNIGSSRYGGSIHAAEFIKRFINKGTPWAHLDIAGVSWSMKGGQTNIPKLHNPGATAFGVRLIDNYLRGK